MRTRKGHRRKLLHALYYNDSDTPSSEEEKDKGNEKEKEEKDEENVSLVYNNSISIFSQSNNFLKTFLEINKKKKEENFVRFERQEESEEETNSIFCYNEKQKEKKSDAEMEEETKKNCLSEQAGREIINGGMKEKNMSITDNNNKKENAKYFTQIHECAPIECTKNKTIMHQNEDDEVLKKIEVKQMFVQKSLQNSARETADGDALICLKGKKEEKKVEEKTECKNKINKEDEQRNLSTSDISARPVTQTLPRTFAQKAKTSQQKDIKHESNFLSSSATMKARTRMTRHLKEEEKEKEKKKKKNENNGSEDDSEELRFYINLLDKIGNETLKQGKSAEQRQRVCTPPLNYAIRVKDRSVNSSASHVMRNKTTDLEKNLNEKKQKLKSAREFGNLKAQEVRNKKNTSFSFSVENLRKIAKKKKKTPSCPKRNEKIDYSKTFFHIPEFMAKAKEISVGNSDSSICSSSFSSSSVMSCEASFSSSCLSTSSFYSPSFSSSSSSPSYSSVSSLRSCALPSACSSASRSLGGSSRCPSWSPSAPSCLQGRFKEKETKITEACFSQTNRHKSKCTGHIPYNENNKILNYNTTNINNNDNNKKRNNRERNCNGNDMHSCGDHVDEFFLLSDASDEQALVCETHSNIHCNDGNTDCANNSNNRDDAKISLLCNIKFKDLKEGRICDGFIDNTKEQKKETSSSHAEKQINKKEKKNEKNHESKFPHKQDISAYSSYQDNIPKLHTEDEDNALCRLLDVRELEEELEKIYRAETKLKALEASMPRTLRPNDRGIFKKTKMRK